MYPVVPNLNLVATIKIVLVVDTKKQKLYFAKYVIQTFILVNTIIVEVVQINYARITEREDILKMVM